MNLVTIALVVLGWFVCGGLSLFVGGITDRFFSPIGGLDDRGSKEPEICWFLGPIGLVVLIIAIIVLTLSRTFKRVTSQSFSSWIYHLGRGSK